MKFLITGGAGFIGSNYLHYVVDKYKEDTFVCLDALTYAGNYNNIKMLEGKENYKFIHGDIGLKDEFLLPEILRRGIKENKFKMLATTSESKWMGVTYKEDLPDLKKNIEDLIKKGEYPNELWDTRRSKSTRS